MKREADKPDGFWRRRVVALLLDQLRQGVTPEKIALTIALGAVLATFPILGSTTLLCGIAGVALRLNQPIIQLVNWLCYPLQILLLIPLYRAGEWFGAPHLSLSIPQLVVRFQQMGPFAFSARFGLIAVGGVAAWALIAPLAGTAVYALTRLLLTRTVRRLALGAAVASTPAAASSARSRASRASPQ